MLDMSLNLFLHLKSESIDIMIYAAAADIYADAAHFIESRARD